jgi:4-diphosphocytidyl-2-C-methyl-D-erythritol kinase
MGFHISDQSIFRLLSLPETKISLFSPAKINLFLVVYGKRPDGYHSIWSMVTFLRLGDTVNVNFEISGDRDIFECTHSGVPTDERNTILQALAEFRRRHPCPPLHIKLKKKIPVGAGFGGGSSNGIIFLKGVNDYFKRPLSQKVLRQIAIKLGSDCPLFLGNTYDPMWMSGRGEKVRPAYEFSVGLRGRRIFLLIPPLNVCTAEAYEKLDQYNARWRGARWRRNVGRIKRHLGRGDIYPFNDFESPFMYYYPDLRHMQRELEEKLYFKICLTGTGSGFYGFPPDSLSIGTLKRFVSDFWETHWQCNFNVIETAIR